MRARGKLAMALAALLFCAAVMVPCAVFLAPAGDGAASSLPSSHGFGEGMGDWERPSLMALPDNAPKPSFIRRLIWLSVFLFLAALTCFIRAARPICLRRPARVRIHSTEGFVGHPHQAPPFTA